MSRGLGRVAAELLSIFLKEPTDLYPTSELCKQVYRVTDVEKKHRVGVLRAMQTLVERGDVSIWRVHLENEKSEDEWFNGRRSGVPYSSPLLSRRVRPNSE
jgi:hypothetical protein